jgi:hypothetical protein
MPCYYCYQSLCICCLEVLFGVGQVGLRMCWEGKLPNYGIGPSTVERKRRKESRIENVVPGPRPGLGSFVVELWRLHW